MVFAFPLETEVPRVQTLRPLVTATATDLPQSVVAPDLDLVYSYEPPFVSNLHHPLLPLLLLHPLVYPFACRAECHLAD
jgi:hypothetical protein